MAPFTFILPLLFTAQALSMTISTRTTTPAAMLTTSIPSAITPAPAFTKTICTDDLHNFVAAASSHGGTEKRRFFCPGVVQGVAADGDIASAYCCINAVFVPEIPLTSWYYNHTGVAIPSTVITPSCVQPIPLTASDYSAQVSAATPAVTGGAQVRMGGDAGDVELDVDIGLVAYVTSASAARTAMPTGAVVQKGAAAAGRRADGSTSVVALLVAVAGVLVSGAAM